MLIELSYCETCEKELRDYGGIACEFFKLISESFYLQGSIAFSTHIHDGLWGSLELIKFLEIKGYVVSTESSQSTIQIRPLGFDYKFESQNLNLHFCKCHIKI